MKRLNLKVKTECMIFILLAFCLGQVFAAECGDVNSNGKVDIVDALVISQYSVGLNPANFNSQVADVSGNDNIDIVDALFVSQFSVGLISSFPGCKQTPTPPVPLYINEFLASNATINQDPDYGDYADWIEIYNAGSQPVNLNGYYVTDNLNNPAKWQITRNVTINPGGYVLIWADDNDTGLHANFKLAQEGEEIGLFTPEEVLVDSVTFGEQTTDMSEGRKSDGSSELAYFVDPTPGTGNTTTSFSGMVYNVPDFSVTGGFYTSTVVTALSAFAGDTIRYTTDGSEPSGNSTIYRSPISISRTTIIRARVFNGNSYPGPVVTHTYFINEHVQQGTLPVISLASAPENFWDSAKGIYVQNFKPDWEIPINIELFENNGSDRAAFNQPAGTKVNGLNSWVLPQKYLGIYFRKQYTNSDSKLEYPLFFDRSRSNYKSFGLRSSGSDWSYTLFRDALAQNSTRPYMNADMQGYRPSVVYINGQYMGIHNIRSKVNDDFIEKNFGMEGGSYDLIENGTTVDEGSLDAYNEFKSLIARDLSVQANYNAVAEKMDIQEFTDFIITEIYVRNTSFQHNIVTWKPKDSGKWRWIITDMDRGFFLAKDDPLGAFYIDRISSFASDSSTPLGRLLNNAGYRTYFGQRMADHLFTTFHPTRMKKLIDTFKQNIEQEIPYHIQRWQGTTSSYGNAIPSVDFWNNQINYMKTFADTRPQFLLNDLTSSYGIGQAANLAITVSPADGGTVNINGLAVPEADWSGSYPGNLQSQLTAVAKPGYTFRGWAYRSNPNSIISTSTVYNFTLTGDSGFTAVFQATGQSLLPANITGNTTLYRTSSPYLAQGDITIQPYCTLTIQSGVEIWMPKGANIFIGGNINATGASGQPVVFKINPAFAGASWGALCFTNTTATSNFTYVTVEDASQGPIPIENTAAISAFHANLVLDHLTIENVYSNPVAGRYSDIVLTNSSLHMKVTGDLINVKYGSARIEDSIFRGDISTVDTDAIDFDSVPNGIIRNCRIFNFFGDNNDAMDLGGKETNVAIDNALAYNIYDKGLSVGQKATVKVTNSTFVDCGMGMGLKDISNTVADHCTFYGNNKAIACYEKAPGRLGGNAVVTNCILSNSTEASYTADDKSNLDIKYSISDNTMLPSDPSNLFGDPLFIDPTGFDFRLQPSSPCTGRGSDQADMGTLSHEYNGEPSLMFSGIYYNPLNDDSKPEFLTLYNPGQQPIDLSGYKITEGIKFTFPDGTILQAGESYLLSKKAGVSLIGARPGNSAKWESGSLANEGEPLKLENKYGMVVDYVDFKAESPWPLMATSDDVLTLKAYNLDNHLAGNWSVTAYYDMVVTE